MDRKTQLKIVQVLGIKVGLWIIMDKVSHDPIIKYRAILFDDGRWWIRWEETIGMHEYSK